MEGLSGSLIHWLKTFSVEGLNGSVEDFSDGVVIARVLNNIDSGFFNDVWLSKIKTDAGENWRLKVSNLKKILKGILDYYNEVLGQQITGFRMPDVNAVAEKNDFEELGRLLQLILGCAVNCGRKQEFIEALMNLEEDIQHDVMNAIQELMMKEIPTSYQSETYTDLNNQIKGLNEDLNSTKESKEQIRQRCHELDMQVAVLLEEKNSLLSENEKLLERLNHIESFEDPSTLAGKRFQQMQQKLELLQDELFKIETGRDELKSKVENQQKEIIDLQQKNKNEDTEIINYSSHNLIHFEHSYAQMYESRILVNRNSKINAKRDNISEIKLSDEIDEVSSLKVSPEVQKIPDAGNVHELEILSNGKNNDTENKNIVEVKNVSSPLHSINAPMNRPEIKDVEMKDVSSPLYSIYSQKNSPELGKNSKSFEKSLSSKSYGPTENSPLSHSIDVYLQNFSSESDFFSALFPEFQEFPDPESFLNQTPQKNKELENYKKLPISVDISSPYPDTPVQSFPETKSSDFEEFPDPESFLNQNPQKNKELENYKKLPKSGDISSPSHNPDTPVQSFPETKELPEFKKTERMQEFLEPNKITIVQKSGKLSELKTSENKIVIENKDLMEVINISKTESFSEMKELPVLENLFEFENFSVTDGINEEEKARKLDDFKKLYEFEKLSEIEKTPELEKSELPKSRQKSSKSTEPVEDLTENSTDAVVQEYLEIKEPPKTIELSYSESLSDSENLCEIESDSPELEQFPEPEIPELENSRKLPKSLKKNLSFKNNDPLEVIDITSPPPNVPLSLKYINSVEIIDIASPPTVIKNFPKTGTKSKGKKIKSVKSKNQTVKKSRSMHEKSTFKRKNDTSIKVPPRRSLRRIYKNLNEANKISDVFNSVQKSVISNISSKKNKSIDPLNKQLLKSSTINKKKKKTTNKVMVNDVEALSKNEQLLSPPYRIIAKRFKLSEVKVVLERDSNIDKMSDKSFITLENGEYKRKNDLTSKRKPAHSETINSNLSLSDVECVKKKRFKNKEKNLVDSKTSGKRENLKMNSEIIKKREQNLSPPSDKSSSEEISKSATKTLESSIKEKRKQYFSEDLNILSPPHSADAKPKVKKVCKDSLHFFINEEPALFSQPDVLVKFKVGNGIKKKLKDEDKILPCIEDSDVIPQVVASVSQSDPFYNKIQESQSASNSRIHHLLETKNKAKELIFKRSKKKLKDTCLENSLKIAQRTENIFKRKSTTNSTTELKNITHFPAEIADESISKILQYNYDTNEKLNLIEHKDHSKTFHYHKSITECKPHPTVKKKAFLGDVTVTLRRSTRIKNAAEKSRAFEKKAIKKSSSRKSKSEDKSQNSEDDDPNELWCLCRQPHNDRFMIMCDDCEDWFHGDCVNVTKQQGLRLEKLKKEWKCPNCQQKGKDASTFAKSVKTYPDAIKNKSLDIIKHLQLEQHSGNNLLLKKTHKGEVEEEDIVLDNASKKFLKPVSC